jgi:glycosyltransferase involved in cell wall biosynthesis
MTPAPLHVHVLIDSLSWGGAELLLGELARGAGAQGFVLSVSHLYDDDAGPAAARLRSAGVEPRFLSAGGLLAPRTLMRVRRHLAALHPDVLHTHLEYADLVGGAAARTLGLPAVSTLHVMDPRAGARDRVRARLATAVRRRWHARVIAVSDHLRTAYLTAGADRPAHVTTVHNGIATHAAPGAGALVRAELGIGPDELVVAVVAVLRPGKGHDLAIAAVEEVGRTVAGVRLEIAGDGPARDEVARSAARLGDRARLIGHRDDIMAVLDAADVLLHPSRADAFPTVLLEALAAGVPIVATAVGGIPEIVEGGRTGLLVEPPFDHRAFVPLLARLLADPDLRRAIARRGRERFDQEFTADRWAARLRAVYEDVTA